MLEQLEKSTSRQDGGNSKEIAKSVPVSHRDSGPKDKKTGCKGHNIHKPNSIIFVRRRMLYARPELNGRGEVRFGLRHIRTSSNCKCYLDLILTDK